MMIKGEEMKKSYKFYLFVIIKNLHSHNPFKNWIGEIISEYRAWVLNIRRFRETIKDD